MARSLSPVLWLCVLPALIAGCARTEPRTTSQQPEEQLSAVDCHKPPFAGSVACRDRGGERSPALGFKFFFKDRGDRGDDPRRAGCHEFFTARMCRSKGVEFAGDSCLDDGVTLIELTSRVCHTRLDRRTYNCNDFCKERGFAAGSCRKVRVEVCAPNGSAECKCTGKD